MKRWERLGCLCALAAGFWAEGIWWFALRHPALRLLFFDHMLK